jgi:WD40 repeat protein/serine/threonine protein kinase
MGTKLPSVETVFGEAMEIATPAERSAYLDRACGGDATLRRQVESLLDATDRAGDFLESPAGMPTLTHATPSPVEGPGAVIGPYKLLEQIGEGGMGVVYMAEQTHPIRRRVALKVIKPGMDSRQVIARFEAERQALALMNHPNIARVHDAGATESGRPYFVMELVRGIPITDYCDRERMPLAARLELFVLVCRAVQHAHQKGVIHRDLKPSNVLVTVIDGAAVPKVIDFGVAKATGPRLTERTLFTGFHQFVGTPMYMSPEQADLSGVDVDTRSDVYALGILLYELLTGSTPFDSEALRKAAFDEMRRMIREDEPPTPSTRLSSLGQTLTAVASKRACDPRHLDRAVRGELDWITMKALEKDRRRRYETANDFAADVMNHLTDRPVEACPPSPSYRFGKFARRNRAAMTTAVLISAVVGVGLVTSLWFAVAASEAERHTKHALSALKASFGVAEARRAEAIAREREAKSLLARSLIRGGTKLLDEGSGLGLFDLVNAHAEAEHDPSLREAAAALWAVGIAPLQGRLAAVVGGGDVLEFSPDGRLLATAEGGTVILWETSGWHRRAAPLEHGSGKTVLHIRFNPQGSGVATLTTGGEVRLWDATTGRASGAPLRDEIQGLRMHPPLASYLPLAFSPDGKLLASGSPDGRARVWDTTTREAVGPRASHDGPVFKVAFSPDGAILATGSKDGTVRLWDVKTWEPIGPTLRQEDMIHAMAWSPDGSLLATASGFCKTRLWEIPSGRLHCEPLVTNEWVVTLDFSPDGRRLATGSVGWEARLWDTATGRPYGEPMRHDGMVPSLRFSPDGRLLATRAFQSLTRLWDVKTQKLYGSPLAVAGDEFALSFSPDGDHLAVGTPTGTHVWRVREDWAASYEHDDPVWAVDLSPDGKTLATASGCAVRLWEAETRRRREFPLSGVTVDVSNFAFNPASVKFSPDGTLLAVIDTPTTVRLLDASTCQPVGRGLDHQKRVQGVAFSPDGRHAVTSTFATQDEPAIIRLWDLPTRTLLGSQPAGGLCVEVSPDGRQVAAGTREWTAQVWSLTDGFKLDRTIPQNGWCLSLGYSADGSRLATGTFGGRAFVRDAATGELRGTAIKFDGPVTDVKLSHDGGLLLTSEWDYFSARPESVRFWSLSAGPPYHSVTLSQSVGTLVVSVTPDWRWLATGQKDGTARVFRMTVPPATTREMRLRTEVALGMRSSGVDYEAIKPEEWQTICRELVPDR